MPLDQAKIKSLRELRKLTLQEAGVAAGFTASAARIRWHDLESGKITDPRLSTLESVCVALGCGLQDLLADAKKTRKRGQRDKSASGSAGS